MIALVAAHALAAPDLKKPKPDPAPATEGEPPAPREPEPTLDHLARLEWDRAEPMAFAALIAGEDTATRAAGLRALGRLRDRDAVEVLGGWADDGDLEVRIAVAEALGLTPASKDLLRPWLARLALLHARGVKGIQDLATPALVEALAASDPRAVDDAAWALSRMKPDLSGHTTAVQGRLRAGLGVEARAWLVKAAWPWLSPEARDELFLRAMTDAPRLVQVAVLQALRPEDVEAEVLAAFLSDADPWVRAATLDALGRSDEEAAADTLLRHAEEAGDPYERADAVLALGRSDPERAGDASLPAPVRAAWVATLTDRDLLVTLATTSDEAGIRTAAAGALSELDDARPSDGAALLGGADPVVRAVGVDLLKDPAAVLAHLATEEHPEVRAAAWRALATLLQDPKALAAAKRDARLAAAVSAAPTRDRGLAAVHVEAVARLAGLPAVDVPRGPEPDEVTVPVGSDGAVTVDLRPQDLAEIRRIRSAVVVTDRGTFVVRLAPEVAPLAVSSFAALAEGGWFDGLLFHRVVPGFVVQTGDPRGDGWGGPGYVLPDEDSEVLFDTGSLGMAREPDRDTGGSQWFVTTSPQPHLTSEYTWFGEVVQGMAVVDHLTRGAVVEDVVIERVP